MKSNPIHIWFFSPYFNWESVVHTSSGWLIWVGLVLSLGSCVSPRLHYVQMGVSMSRMRRQRHTWVANLSMNSINTRMPSVSCTNLKPTVVKIGPLDGRSAGLILQLFPWLKTNASFITTVIETKTDWSRYQMITNVNWLVFTNWALNMATFWWWIMKRSHCILRWSQCGSTLFIHF